LPVAREINAGATRNIDREELKTFMKVLSKMKDNLGEELA
jgi:hypothetical protein